MPRFKSPYGSQHSGRIPRLSYPPVIPSTASPGGTFQAWSQRQRFGSGVRLDVGQHSEQRFCRFCGSSMLQSSDSSHVQDFDAQLVAQVRTSNAPKNVKQHKQRPKLLPPVGLGYSIFSDTFLCLFCQVVL